MITESQQSSSPDIEAYLAMQLLKEGDRQAAISKCHEGISQYGPNGNLYLVKARAHLELEEYGFAQEALLSLLSLDPEHPAAWAMLGEVYYQLGNTPKVDYCRSRLKQIFPVLTEPEDESENETSAEKATGQEPSIVNGVGESTPTIVPLEEIAGSAVPDIAQPESPQNPSVKPAEESLVADVINADLGSADDQNNAAGVGVEIFETATFADICLDQGKFEKALEIYAKLSRVHPDNLEFQDQVKTIQAKMGIK